MHKLMLFTECDCRVGLVGDNGSLTAKLMQPKRYRSRHCLAERMSRSIRITAGPHANPQRPIGKAEQPQHHAVVQPCMNPRVLRREVKIRRGLAVLTQADAALELRVGRGKFPVGE
jgi:hypothetical protein